jgi:hypothetical protein
VSHFHILNIPYVPLRSEPFTKFIWPAACVYLLVNGLIYFVLVVGTETIDDEL